MSGELLQVLASKNGLSFISDLRFLSPDILKHEFTKLKHDYPDRWSQKEWDAAADYLQISNVKK